MEATCRDCLKYATCEKERDKLCHSFILAYPIIPKTKQELEYILCYGNCMVDDCKIRCSFFNEIYKTIKGENNG